MYKTESKISTEINLEIKYGFHKQEKIGNVGKEVGCFNFMKLCTNQNQNSYENKKEIMTKEK